MTHTEPSKRRSYRVFFMAALVVLLASPLLSPPIVQAETSVQTIYIDVSNVGDPYEDGSHDHPFDGIQEGVDVASVGDTVMVAPGVYFEGVVIGEAKSGISLVGEEGAVIDGEGLNSGIRVGIGLSRPDYIDNVTIAGFTVRNCVKGITLMRCRNARLRNNTMIDNLYNFADYSLVVNDVDTSNTVNGKPIYYWVNEDGKEVPSDAGYVALVNSRNILVKDLILTSNGQGLLFKNTTLSRVENISVVNNQDGVYFDLQSKNNTIFGNTISNNTFMGIYMSTSSGNTIVYNTISHNYYGVYVATSYGVDAADNIIADNNIQGHWKGIVLHGGHASNPVANNLVKDNLLVNNSLAISMHLSASNLIWHNNFLDNAEQIESYESENLFYRLEEGNFWDDYAGADGNNDAVGDIPYVIDQANKDNYPLMGFFKSLNIAWEGVTYTLDTISSSTVADLSLDHSKKSVNFEMLTDGNETSFCRVTVPEIVLSGPYTVIINDSQTTELIEESNGTHAFLFFAYSGSGGKIEILGDTIIPEFLQAVYLSFLMIATSSIALFYRKSMLKAKGQPG